MSKYRKSFLPVRARNRRFVLSRLVLNALKFLLKVENLRKLPFKYKFKYGKVCLLFSMIIVCFTLLFSVRLRIRSSRPDDDLGRNNGAVRLLHARVGGSLGTCCQQKPHRGHHEQDQQRFRHPKGPVFCTILSLTGIQKRDRAHYCFK